MQSATTPSVAVSGAGGAKNSGGYFDFMSSHKLEKGNVALPTNTRIGGKDQDKDVYGASYVIPEDNYLQFLDLYYNAVVINKRKEYLTERQLDSNGPILIDIDLSFKLGWTERMYTSDHIADLLDAYLGNLKKMYQFDGDAHFQIYVMEKPELIHVEDKNKTKDGIHIIIGIQSDHITQQILRKSMVPLIAEMWKDMPVINDWEDVLDNSISTGKTNWQLYGSQKPGSKPYVLTTVYDISYDDTDDQMSMKHVPLKQFDLKKNFAKLSARYKDHPAFFYKNEFIDARQVAIASGSVEISGEKKQRRVATLMPQNSASMSIFDVKTRADLNLAVSQFLDNLLTGTDDYELKEAYQYTMTLPEPYYGSGSYSKWIRVGWALRNISDRLFVIWVLFSAQSPEFHFGDIPDLYDRWTKFDLGNLNGLTKRSIMHWAKMDARDKYIKIHEESVDYYVEQTIKVSKGECDEDAPKKRGPARCGEFDLAQVLKHMYKDEYVCVSIKGNIWYAFGQHRWQEIDSGSTLRTSISTSMRDVYRRKAHRLMDLQAAITDDSDSSKLEMKMLKVKSNKCLEICSRLAQTTDKTNIMKECKDVFYDNTFMDKLDINPYLMCFNNGVMDFKTNTFRRGYPEDCMSKTTGIDYIPLDPKRDSLTMAEINTFMAQLFPVKELYNYMWEHLASTLIGTCPNQTFNMYIGVGSNGKSVLVNLMGMVLGEYAETSASVSIITSKRAQIGGVSPEMADLKGIRYAVMNEPDKEETVNVGIMKQLTSGVDEFQARKPFMPEMVRFVPQFKLALCANEFMEIKSMDHGTWRRIRVVDFMSMFTQNPVQGDPTCPYQFKIIDEAELKEKFESWKHVFMAMLAEKAFQTHGYVNDCDIVLKASKSYRESQDYIAEFIADKIIIDPTNPAAVVQKTELTSDFNIWYQGAYGKKSPKIKDVQAYMDKKFGKYEKHKCWKGVRINYGDDNHSGSISERGDNVDDDDECEIIEEDDL
jgi:P4 family phage/plasmid primase-like protien